MEGLPFQPPSASLEVAGFAGTLLRASSQGFLQEKNPSWKYLAVFAQENKQTYFFSPIGSVYYCIISFSCSLENVVSLLEDGERLFIKEDGNKAESLKERPWDV